MREGSIERLSSIGEEFSERREDERESGLTGREMILGERLIKFQEEFQDIDKIIEAEINLIQKKLRTIASENPQLVLSFFRKNLGEIKNLDELAEREDLSGYSRGRFFRAAVSQELVLRRKKGEKVSRERVKREMLAKEMASIFAFRLGVNSIPKDASIFVLEETLVWQFRSRRDEAAPKISQLSPETISEIMRVHIKRVTKARENFPVELENILPEIRDKIFRAIDKGVLDIEREVAKERINLLKFDLMDELVAKMEKVGGIFVPKTHEALISESVSRKALPSVLAHEIFHALSGQEEVVREEDEGIGEFFPDQIKVGLGYGKITGQDWRVRLRWLNEATTEQATMDLLGLEESESYERERILLQKLLDLGLPKKMLYRAYFENYKSQPEGTPSNPAARELFNFTNSKFGYGFLFNLDLYIRIRGEEKMGNVASWEAVDEAGVEEAVEKFEKEKENFPAFIRQWAKNYHSKRKASLLRSAKRKLRNKK